jgi:hypothetical protein
MERYSMDLNEILSLVGPLDDTPGDNTARERFRDHLKRNVSEVSQIRDYIEECLRSTGDQYNKALQDLVNYVGNFLGFVVSYGRYHGTQSEIGYDGYWRSPRDFHVVVEVKTTEVYAIKTITLVGYIDALISDKEIPNWENTLGFYIIGRPDPDIKQLENAIIAEKRTDQLRVISVDSLLTLAEIMNEYDINHDDILALLRPSGPSIDPVVELMARVVAETKTEVVIETEMPDIVKHDGNDIKYWLTPVKSGENETAEECVRRLVGEVKIYAFGERTPGRKVIKPGDWICFYASGNGVIAHAEVASYPELKKHRAIKEPDKYPWIFELKNTDPYIEEPVVINATLRAKLNAFAGREQSSRWAWLVQGTSKITEHDFKVLTRQLVE